MALLGTTASRLPKFAILHFEALGDVTSLLATEEQDSSKAISNLEDSIPAPPEMGGVVLRIVPAESGDQKDRKEPRAEGDQVY